MHHETRSLSEAASLFELLGDEDCRRILTALDDGPMPAAALAEACSIPRSTLYRKLDRLADASLVDSATPIRTSGRDATTFERTVDSVTVRLPDEPAAPRPPFDP